MSFRPSAAAVKLQVEAALAHKVPSALTPAARPAPEVIPTGVAQLDSAIGGGIARGTVTEICGPASSGRTSVLLSLLAQVTRRGEAVALVDANDAFHPESAERAGVELKRLLWVRCQQIAELRDCGTAESEKSRRHPERSRGGTCSSIPHFRSSAIPQSSGHRKARLQSVEQALKATDLLLQSGGFGLIVVDLGDVRAEDARRVPLTTWFRFRRAIENTPAALVIVEQEPYAKTCAALVMELKAARSDWIAKLQNCKTAELEKQIPQFGNSAVPQCSAATLPTHSHLLHGMQIEVEISRGQLIGKKPVRSVPVFETSTELATSH